MDISGVCQWVHLSWGTLFRCVEARRNRCTLCIQMQHWSFICWVLQRLADDRGSVYGRQRADWFDLSFSLSLHHQMFIPFSVTDSGMCAPSVHTRLHEKDPAPAEVDRLHRTLCHRPGRGDEGGWVGGCGGREKKTGLWRQRAASWWCPREANN